MQDLSTRLLEALRGIIREEVRLEVARGGSPAVSEPFEGEPRTSVRAWLDTLPADGEAWRARDAWPRFCAFQEAAGRAPTTMMALGRYLTREQGRERAGRILEVAKDRTGTHLYRLRGV